MIGLGGLRIESGQITLSGAASYSGAATVVGGTVTLSGSGGLGGGAGNVDLASETNDVASVSMSSSGSPRSKAHWCD